MPEIGRSLGLGSYISNAMNKAIDNFKVLANTASKLSFEPEPQDDMDFEVEQVQENWLEQAMGSFKTPVVEVDEPIPPKQDKKKVPAGVYYI